MTSKSPLTSYILQTSSTSIDQISAFLSEFNIKLHQNNPDILTIDDRTGWGIAEIRKATLFLHQKPLKSDTKTLLILDAHNLTAEAQNSLLKTLEEPPAHSLIILTTPNHLNLLDTICSRCKLITFTPSNTSPDYTPWTIPTTIESALQLSDEILKTTDKSLLPQLIDLQVSHFHQLLTKSPSTVTSRIINGLLHLKAMINQNVDPRGALDYFFLSLISKN